MENLNASDVRERLIHTLLNRAAVPIHNLVEEDVIEMAKTFEDYIFNGKKDG
jgi:hypothetical protein